MTQFKAKKTKSGHGENVPAGLLMYPVLQAADILLYKATSVPVGPDQLQHLELTRELASKFNRQFSTEYFFPPVATRELDLDACPRIMSLVCGTVKMSKSDPNEEGKVMLLDSPDEIRRKIKKATTDNFPTLSYDPINRPNVANLLQIYALCNERSKCSLEQTVHQYNMTPQPYASFKHDLAEMVIETCRPIRQKYHEQEEEQVKMTLWQSEQQAMQIASRHYQEISDIVGLSVSGKMMV